MLSKEEYLEEIEQIIVDGDEEEAAKVVAEALEDGISAFEILNDGLMAGAKTVGRLFETGELFLPELMMTGRALKAAMALITPVLQTEFAGNMADSDTGVVVMATVQTDIHDIGKNIVSSMLVATGFEVVDLGVDVPIKSIIAKAKEVNANIIGCSALLTTSMPFMRDLVDLLKAMGERDRFKVMVGGASVTPLFAEKIGADGTAPNAMEAVQLAKRLIREQRQQQAVGV